MKLALKFFTLKKFRKASVFVLFCAVLAFFLSGCATTKNTEDVFPKSGNEKQADSKKKEKNAVVQRISDVPFLAARENPKPYKFDEVWIYVLEGKEKGLEIAEECVTDIGYFGATLDSFGRLRGVPDRNKLKNSNAKVHMVVVDTEKSLTHFCLYPGYSVRRKLLNDIVRASRHYDGVQIDFELVMPEDKAHYYSFLRELKARLPKKTVSVAIPARVKTLKKDAYNYRELSRIVDRIVVMAYDEHWSTSRPGPVASVSWCQDIMNYSLTQIPAEKLIMGIPFYGRCWNTDNTAGAYRYIGVNNLQKKAGITEIKRVDGVPSFEIKKTVTYQFYYDDVYSLAKRLKIYNGNGIKNVSFWRLGLEDTAVWKYIKPKK